MQNKVVFFIMLLFRKVFVLSYFLLLSSCNYPHEVITDFYMYPNPFRATSSSLATFKVVFSKAIDARVSITVRSASFTVLWEDTKTFNSNAVSIPWNGKSHSHNIRPGIYYAVARITGAHASEKTIEIIIK